MRLAELAAGPARELQAVRAPMVAAAAYAAALVALARAVGRLLERHVLPVVQQLAAGEARVDAAEPPAPKTPDQVVQAVARVLFEVEDLPQKKTAVRAAIRTAASIDKTNAAQNGQVLHQLGLDPFEDEPELQAARDRWARTNAALIKDIPDEMARRIERRITDGVAGGKRWETIAKELQDEPGIGERRARLIARDQVSKFNSDLNRTRQTSVGITHYKWMGAMDARERPTHVALQGRIFSWETGTPEGHPGQAVQCRCTAIPVVSKRDMAKAEVLTAEQLEQQAKTLGPTVRQARAAAKKTGPRQQELPLGKKPAAKAGQKRLVRGGKPPGDAPVTSSAAAGPVRPQERQVAEGLADVATPQGQKQARDGARAVMRDEGWAPFDDSLPQGDVLTVSTDPYAQDSWAPDGSMEAATQTVKGARAWSLGARDETSLAAIHRLLHESAHGAGIEPDMPTFRKNRTAAEVLNELATRRLLRERYGVTGPTVLFGYTDAVNVAASSLAELLAVPEAVALRLLEDIAWLLKRAGLAGIRAGMARGPAYRKALVDAVALSGKISKRKARTLVGQWLDQMRRWPESEGRMDAREPAAREFWAMPQRAMTVQECLDRYARFRATSWWHPTYFGVLVRMCEDPQALRRAAHELLAP